MNQKETTMNQLEQSIRTKAVDAFRRDLTTAIHSVISRHNAMESSKTVSQKISCIDQIITNNEVKIGNEAVSKFLKTYEQLLTEFPQFENGGES